MPTQAAALSASVLICSFRRPIDLARCLDALAAQLLLPDDILVIVRDSDAETLGMLAARPADRLPVTLVTVTRPGTVHARNAGLDVCRTDVVAIIDDDTAPHPDWLARVVAHFAEKPNVGGVGGRDRCHNGERFIEGNQRVVGRLQWFGRMIGNHHVGSGPPQDVHMLKGANMSFRMSAVASIRFDLRLRGSGAVPYEDIVFSMAVRRAGWQLLYDPEVVVDHFSGARDEPRYYSDVLPVTDVESFRNYAFNGVVALWDELPLTRQLAFAAWSVLVGTRVCPGLVQAFRFTPSLGWEAWRRFGIALQGLAAAYRELLRQSRVGAGPGHDAAAHAPGASISSQTLQRNTESQVHETWT